MTQITWKDEVFGKYGFNEETLSALKATIKLAREATVTATGKKLEGFTPGPWRLREYPGSLKPAQVYGPVHPVDGGDYAALCELTNPQDAALIAQAPTLLEQRNKLREALRKLHSCTLGYHDSTEEANNETMKHFGDALAEAERVLREVGE